MSKKDDLTMPKIVTEYVAKHRDDALICAAFVALLLALLIIP